MNINTQVFERARTDRAFRDRLLTDPCAVLTESGSPPPSHVRLAVVDVQANEIHLNLGLDGGAPGFGPVLKRASEDRGFRQRLLADPIGVLRDVDPGLVPPGATVRVHEPAAEGVVRLFVPPLEDSECGELSDSELHAVAGGGLFKNIVGAIKEWRCLDTNQVHLDNDKNTYTIMTDTSHKPPSITEEGSLVVW